MVLALIGPSLHQLGENLHRTFLFNLTFVKMEWTLQVLLNMEPNASVNPAMRTQALPVQRYGNASTEVNFESNPRMMTEA